MKLSKCSCSDINQIDRLKWSAGSQHLNWIQITESLTSSIRHRNQSKVHREETSNSHHFDLNNTFITNMGITLSIFLGLSATQITQGMQGGLQIYVHHPQLQQMICVEPSGDCTIEGLKALIQEQVKPW